MKIFYLLIAVVMFSACKTYSDEELSVFDEEIQEYLKENNISCEKSSSGLYFNITEPGEGELIQYTDVVSFKYTGTLLDGTEFDRQQKKPVEFRVSELIGAWKEIMLELKPGGKAFIIAPPQLGYGTHDLEDIPKNSVLVFDMEVVEVK